MPKNKTSTFNRSCYTLVVRDGTSAEIDMYGEIVESRPVDWYTNEPIPGEYIVFSEFVADIKALEGINELTIRMNSLGGDAISSIAIHNLLRALPATVTVIVPGVAMSGGSLIICAADRVKVYASSIIMVHNAWSFVYGGYNSTELVELAESLSAYDRSQAEIYARKTGKTIDEMLEIMSKTPYLNGREAVELGIADELLDDEMEIDIAVSANKRQMYVNGHTMRIVAKGTLPEGIKTIDTVPQSVECRNKEKPKEGNTEGGNSMPMTFEEFQKENPDAAQQMINNANASARANAIASERQRIADIDAIASLFDEDTVYAAKYGDTACTAQEMTHRAALANVEQGKQFMKDMQSDHKASGAACVPAAPAEQDDPNRKLTPDELIAQGKADAQRVSGNKEGK